MEQHSKNMCCFRVSAYPPFFLSQDKRYANHNSLFTLAKQEKRYNKIKLVKTNFNSLGKRKSKGFGRNIMLDKMNSGHAKMAEWGFLHIIPDKSAKNT